MPRVKNNKPSPSRIIKPNVQSHRIPNTANKTLGIFITPLSRHGYGRLYIKRLGKTKVEKR
jgi:hypothetical protein